jgi:hypothetical protein
MFKKTLIVVLVILVLVTVSLAAQKASVFDISFSHSYRLDDAQAINYQAYIPGIRVQLNIRPWFGLSLGGMYDFVENMEDVNRALLAAEIVLKAPLGFFEPFVAIGPMYSYTLPETVSLPDTYGAQGRAGMDFKFSRWFSLGLEGVLIAPSLTNLVDGTETFDTAYVEDHLYVGFTVKAKF